MSQEVTTEDIGWKLKTPCSDCPFKRTTPLHTGIMADLPMYEEKIKERRLAHTCHKTDSRADGYVPTYDGQVQICPGSLVFFNNMEKSSGEGLETPDGYPSTQQVLYYAVANKVDLEALHDPDVYTSFTEMKEAYRPMIEEAAQKAKEAEKEDGFVVHVSYTGGNGNRRRFTI
jgi:hypothetical protein